MKKTILTLLLISSILLCSCANKHLPVDSGTESDEKKVQLEENVNKEATESYTDVNPEADDKSSFSTQGSNDLGDENILSQIEASVGIPFRLWNNQSQVLHCISVFESYAKREVERKTDPAHEEQNELEWHITENVLSVTGAWNEDFLVDMSSETATSLTDGMVYDIVPGNIIDGHYTE